MERGIFLFFGFSETKIGSFALWFCVPSDLLFDNNNNNNFINFEREKKKELGNMDNNVCMFSIRGCYDNLSYYVWAKPKAILRHHMDDQTILLGYNCWEEEGLLFEFIHNWKYIYFNFKKNKFK